MRAKLQLPYKNQNQESKNMYIMKLTDSIRLEESFQMKNDRDVLRKEMEEIQKNLPMPVWTFAYQQKFVYLS